MSCDCSSGITVDPGIGVAIVEDNTRSFEPAINPILEETKVAGERTNRQRIRNAGNQEGMLFLFLSSCVPYVRD
jgi:hypothetical protein